MNKKLFKQIKNEWKPNLWLFIELFLVSVVMWYIVDYMYVKMTVYNEPKGFDISNCYLVELGQLTDKSDLYNPKDTNPSIHINELCDRLEHNPAIEAVGLGNNSYPYNGSNSSTFFKYDTIYAEGWILNRVITPGFIKVFRYTGINGETPEQLASKFEGNNLLVTNNIFKDKIKGGAKNIVGKKVIYGGDTVNTHYLAGALVPIKYSDFIEVSLTPSILKALAPKDRWMGLELCVRVRPEYDKDFANTLLKESQKRYNIGNMYISNVKSFDDIRANHISKDWNHFKLFIWGMGFLLLNIFLGLLGTFWFRTQQRRGEIALMKSFGGTNKSVYMRLLSEGIIILLLATIPAIIVDYNLAHADITENYNGETFEIVRFSFSLISSCILIALMMIIGISIPAHKAMKIDPAVALHEE